MHLDVEGFLLRAMIAAANEVVNRKLEKGELLRDNYGSKSFLVPENERGLQHRTGLFRDRHLQNKYHYTKQAGRKL